MTDRVQFADDLLPEEKRAQIAKILRAESFKHAPMLSSLLDYLAQESISGDTDLLKEYVVGMKAFHRPPSFDPTTDTIVRVQVNRLRLKLAKYWQTDGRDDPLTVDIPRGRYIVTFQRRKQAAGAVAEQVTGVEPGVLAALELSRRECAERDLPYRTPSLMLALLSAPERFFERCLDRLEPGLTLNVRMSLGRYVEEILPAIKDIGFKPFVWTDHELVKNAISRANAGGVPRANEKHCLEALLEGSSRTIREFKAHLLGARLPVFEQIVREMPVKESDPNVGTQGTIFSQEQ